MTDLPGMWEPADFSGGWADVDKAPPFEELVEEMRAEENRADQLADLSQHPHVLHTIAFSGTYAEGEAAIERVNQLDQANALSSEIAAGPHAGKRTIMLDLDVPARLVPSSTPGHSHLYIDVTADWSDVLDLLRALARCGAVEDGYVAASARRGFTTLRLPWVSKDHDPIALDRRLHCKGCGRHPSEIDAYTPYAAGETLTNAEYVQREEGTLNPRTGQFYCDACYIAAGQPLGTA